MAMIPGQISLSQLNASFGPNTSIMGNGGLFGGGGQGDLLMNLTASLMSFEQELGMALGTQGEAANAESEFLTLQAGGAENPQQISALMAALSDKQAKGEPLTEEAIEDLVEKVVQENGGMSKSDTLLSQLMAMASKGQFGNGMSDTSATAHQAMSAQASTSKNETGKQTTLLTQNTTANGNAVANQQAKTNGAATWNLHDLRQQLDPALREVIMRQFAQAETQAADGEVMVKTDSTAKGNPMGEMFSSLSKGLSEQVQQQLQATKQSGEQGFNSQAFETGNVVSAQNRESWQPQLVQQVGQTPRMPQMTEQVQQIADYLASRSDGAIRMGDSHVEANLRLYPPQLGEVQVQLHVQNDGLTQARFVVDRPETARVLEAHMEQFRNAMGRQGLNVDQASVVMVSRPSSSGSNQMNSQQQGQSQERSDEQTTYQQDHSESRQQGRESESRQQQRQG